MPWITAAEQTGSGPVIYEISFNRDIFFDPSPPFSKVQSLRTEGWIDSVDVAIVAPRTIEVLPFGSGPVSRIRYVHQPGPRIVDVAGDELPEYDVPLPFP